MTTKPTAKKFRIRRVGSVAALLAADADDGPVPDTAANVPTPGPGAGAVPRGGPAIPRRSGGGSLLGSRTDDGFGSEPFATARGPGDGRQAGSLPGAGAPAPAGPAADDPDAIRAEGLTGRQLRMARRVAQKHGMSPASDLEAVQMLRKAGIDPFQRANMLELVTAEGEEDGQARVQLPSTEVRAEDARAREVWKLQQDIARRRRRKMLLLVARLAVFVFLPTLVAGWYFFRVATPMYATTSEFVIQQADAPAGGALGGLFSGTGLATSQDAITVQGYLQSRDAFLRLDADVGFKAHFSQPFIDPLQRIEADASNEQAYSLFRDLVTIGFDPTEGVVKMEVVAADPATSEAFSRALIRYAEEQVDNLTQRLRADQMEGARSSYAEAEAKMLAAQARVLELQEQLGVLDPASETASLMGQISTFETQLAQKRLELQQLLDNPRPNAARVQGTEGDIARLQTLIGDLRAQLTRADGTGASLARITGELRLAEADLATRQTLMQQALQQMETARIEANRQTRYLSLGVSPVGPDEATYPRAVENTLVSFLIFAGIYLMASLTASILREQVSA
ncbi:MAG: capsule biosynthesis protein [Rhodobacteraceae bacterium]|jgi:capsular polysaccharide transport system permease protein|nr:capsule biosynthesis protein [Paracoccaceae bacterium]